jgi:hypothetical protein
LEVHDHPSPCPLGWVNKDVEIKATKQCKVKFVVSVDFIDEVVLDVVPLDMCVGNVIFFIVETRSSNWLFKYDQLND